MEFKQGPGLQVPAHCVRGSGSATLTGAFVPVSLPCVCVSPHVCVLFLHVRRGLSLFVFVFFQPIMSDCSGRQERSRELPLPPLSLSSHGRDPLTQWFTNISSTPSLPATHLLPSHSELRPVASDRCEGQGAWRGQTSLEEIYPFFTQQGRPSNVQNQRDSYDI